MAAIKESLSSNKTGGINLLPQELRVPGRLKVVARFLSRGSVVVLGIYIFILLLLLLTSFLFSRQEGALLTKNASLAREIEALRSREGLVAVLKSRVRLAQTIFTKAPHVQDNLIDDIVDTLPLGAQVLDILSEAGTTKITAVVSSSAEAKGTFAKLQSIDAEKITLETLSQAAGGGYSFSLEIK